MASYALQIIDAEAGGDISRVIVGGAPRLEGESIAAQCAFFSEHYDNLRVTLMQPPHGELHMCPVLLLPPAHPDADLGVIIMESMGYPPVSGSNLLCAVRVALERGTVAMQEPETPLRVETPVGLIGVTAHVNAGTCGEIDFRNVPVRILETIHGRLDGASESIEVKRVAAGVDYAVVDAASLNVELMADNQSALIDLGRKIAGTAGTDFTMFHGDVRSSGRGLSIRVAVYQAPAVMCRSPTGTGTSALVSLGYTEGWIAPQQTLETVSIPGGSFRGKIAGVRTCDSIPVIDTVISGRSSILGSVNIDWDSNE